MACFLSQTGSKVAFCKSGRKRSCMAEPHLCVESFCWLLQFGPPVHPQLAVSFSLFSLDQISLLQKHNTSSSSHSVTVACPQECNSNAAEVAEADNPLPWQVCHACMHNCHTLYSVLASSVQYSTAQYSTAQHSTAQHSTVQYRVLAGSDDVFQPFALTVPWVSHFLAVDKCLRHQ